MKKFILNSFLFFYLLSSLSAIDIKLIRKFTLEQDEKNFLIAPGSFFVTEDSMIFVIDWRAANIKIYNNDGKLSNVFGRKGLGPDEFVMPYFSDYEKPLLGLADFGRRRYFIYTRNGKSGLELVKCCLNTDMPQDFKFLVDGKLLISGYKLNKEGKWQALYVYNYETNKSDFLLSHARSYGYQSDSDFQNDFYGGLERIGTNQFIDWEGDTIYQVWTGNIKINKINIKTREVISFGKKTENYVQPYLTPLINKGYQEKQTKVISEARAKMSYILDISIIDSKTVALVYVGPLKKNNGLNVMLQFYKDSGEFIKEFEVLLNSKAPTLYDLRFYYKKDANLYYVMETEPSEQYDQVFNVYEYRITE